MRKSGTDFKSSQWFDVLKAAGNLESRKETPFTAAMLSKEAKVQPTTKMVGPKEETVSSANQIAAAWLIKLRKWGYVEQVGTTQGEGPRPAITWQMTKKGRECELREGLQSRFDRLREAALAYRKVRGKKDEALVWKALSDVLDEVNL